MGEATSRRTCHTRQRGRLRHYRQTAVRRANEVPTGWYRPRSVKGAKPEASDLEHELPLSADFESPARGA